MQKNKNRYSFLKAGVFSCLVSGFIVAILLLSQTGDVLTEPVVERSWRNVPVGIINAGGTNSSIEEIYIVLTGQTYTSNLTNTSGYWLAGASHHSHNNTHRSSQVNHSTAFDIVVLVRWNATHAWETSNSTWMLQYVNLTVDCPALSIDDLAMSEFNVSATNNGYMWVNYVANNSGSGYTLSRGQSINNTGGTRGMLFNATAYY